MELVASQEHLQQISLHQLAQQLQGKLLSLPQNLPFQVQCVMKNGSLMVLAQHPPDETIDHQQVFGELEQVIQAALTPELIRALFQTEAIPTGAQAKLYLRQLGQKLPYGSHRFPLSEDSELTDQYSIGESADDFHDNLKHLESSFDRQNGSSDWEQGLTLTLDEPETDESFLLTEALSHEETREGAETQERSPWLWWIAAGIGVSVVSFATGMVLMTRPCMTNQCEPFQSAQNLTSQATQAIQTAQTGLELQQAQQQLKQADTLLESIPLWSQQHGDAEMMQKSNQTNILLLDQVIAAEKLAEDAGQKMRTLPQTVQDWQNIQATWRSAIAQLEKVPQGTPLSNFAQQRLKNYQDSLELTNQAIAAEKQAQKQLAAAKSTASLAQAREGTAQAIENLHQAQVTWQVAVNALKQIPNTTTSFTEAQQLLTDYSSKLSLVRERANREDLAQKSLNQALGLAKKAESLQQQNQWTQAVANWRSAVTQLERIPEGTAYHDQAQTLEVSYSSSLQKAESQLQVAVSQQKLQNDLNRVCAGSPKICNSLILSNSIRVQFTPAYENALKQAYTTGQAGNYAILGGAVNHIESLQTALQAISNNAGLPIEVYNANGTELMGSFNPTGR